MKFESLYVDPRGRTPRNPFVGALLVLLAVAGFYAFVVTGRTAEFCTAVLILPFVVLLARRLHDMGRPAWPLAVPAVLLVAAAWLRLDRVDSRFDSPALLTALAVSAGFILWGVIGKGQAEANRFGAPAAA